ncbi:phenylalanine--tRNA ligase subunit beta [bacterium]|nr:phenylalanine--tRNA ligase subunit beta [candidate division CSSED10-310 bacterium]
MPVVSFPVERFNQLLGVRYSQEQLVEALEQLGCDVEDTTEVVVYECPRCAASSEKLPREAAPRRCDTCGYESAEALTEVGRDRVIRLDLLAARPDLFDAGGLTRALHGFFSLRTGCPRYEVGTSTWEIMADPELAETGSYRPFIVAAVVTMPALDGAGLREIMKLQENLHWGIGRDRKLTSIGVYDLDAVTPPLRYCAEDPDTFSFIPLGLPGQLMTLRRILEEHPKGIGYAYLLAGHKRFPVLKDANGRVLSMPPIINSEDTKVKVGASRFLIDVTGVAEGPVFNTLCTLVSSLLELGGAARSVRIHTTGGMTITTPDLSLRSIPINRLDANRWLGIDLDGRTLQGTLERMRFSVTGDDPVYDVRYPAFRTDIKHQVDVFEDLAIGYGYQNIEATLVKTMTIGRPRPEERLSGIARSTLLGLGFTETMSLNLCAEDSQFRMFRLEPGAGHLVVANAKTRDQATMRSHLMLGLMETLRLNRRKTPPLKIFEIGNTVRLDPGGTNGICEERRLSFAVMGPEAGYAEVRAVSDAILRELGWIGEYQSHISPTFITGRCARILDGSAPLAVLGELHPEVLNNFGLPFPVALGEVILRRIV